MQTSAAKRVYRAIGLMSGTSLDGIDVGLVDTDGENFVEPGPSHYIPYAPELKERIRACFGKTVTDDEIRAVEEEITLLHAEAIRQFMASAELRTSDIDIVGFHGQTITHKPKEGLTWQLGDGARLAAETGIAVVDQFRIQDVQAGGEGAPLIPLYHRALARQKKIALPVAILNIGGVSNVTYIGENEDDILAFDCGPGNALMDDFMLQNFEQSYDFAGSKAKEGQIDDAVLSRWLANEYLGKPAPKSLDRGFVSKKEDRNVNADMNQWDVSAIWDMAPENAMATLAAFTAGAIAAAAQHFPSPVVAWYVSGGGRHNVFLMDLLAKALDAPLKTINDIGYNGDAIESEGFAYLAVRSLLGLPLSLPTTTGVAAAQTGGTLHPL